MLTQETKLKDAPSKTNLSTVIGKTGAAIGNYRWGICALLFFSATINYLDRQVLSILKPTLQTELGWTETDYGWIVFSFQAAYAFGFVAAGLLLDKIGTRIGLALAVFSWSLAAMGHSLARTVAGFQIARIGLALGESGSTPAIVKTTAEWFPKKERALATGITNAGANIGALVAPIVVPWLTINYGWEWAFIVTGAVGFVWLVFWLIFYQSPEKHKLLSNSEREYILSDPPEVAVKVPWISLLPKRETWAFIIARFLTDPIFYIFLFWIPDFLNKKHGLRLQDFGLPLVVIYLLADVGSIVGGWISSTLIKRGWSLNAARKTAMFLCAAAVVPVIFTSQTSKLWTAVLLLGLAAGAHQGWSANLFTMVSDVFPKRVVGSVVGISGMAGAIGGMLIALLVPQILNATGGSYLIIFMMAGSAYLLAFAIVQLLIPRIKSGE